jgi:hypothetical protein
MSNTGTECVFLGYPIGQKGYLLMELKTRKRIVARSVDFDENTFPFQSVNNGMSLSQANGASRAPVISDVVTESEPQQRVSVDGDEVGLVPAGLDMVDPDDDARDGAGEDEHEDASEDEPPVVDENGDFQTEYEQPDRRPVRDRRPPQQYMHEQEDFRRRHCAYLVDAVEPRLPKEALDDAEWRVAMDSLPAGRRAISGKWCFKAKTNENGEVVRKKADMLSAVISFTSLRVLLSLGAQLDLEIVQLDVDTAFLYADLEEEIFME